MKINLKKMSQGKNYISIDQSNLNTVVSNGELRIAGKVTELVSGGQIQSLEEFKASLQSVLPNEKISSILTSLVTSVHLECFNPANNENLYNSIAQGTIAVKNNIITVTGCDGFDTTTTSYNIRSNDLTILNPFAKLVGDYNVKALANQKFEMDPVSVEKRCYADNSNGELSFQPNVGCGETAGSIDMDRFDITIDVKGEGEYSINYTISE